ncbi:ThuA domain-containing protein [Oerskovia jenensis]|uniref:Glucose/arabinose dehydrogenase/regulation of enolase protein 1 (Concanavalin A-like superfamily) n=1 Tax=Oerskovia jenensis TaxID=162169 RepID=A0ABS2LK99_9CELL|nr:ThuA domain-containing protein [Oerskovia jenensis]MBM7480544.1 glucose/arabinose dehydrogenase/regulation of enolase protein 1 (concanavalin A-like superfamily) [Oerskovia jenensis]
MSAFVALTLAAPTLALTATPAAAHDEFSVLVFSKTAGFRHDAIPAGIATIKQLGEDNHFAVTATEDAGAFTEENLAGYDAVVWLSTTGDVLNADQQAAFEAYIADGGGYAGVHAASDTEYDWPWYGDLVGAYFSAHPQNQTATVVVADKDHPSTAHLPSSWERYDEWYNFRENPRGDVHVLATLDESTYSPGGGAMGADHPTAWCQDVAGGRSWYTGGGHTQESYADPAFVQHLLGGIQTAAGAVDAECGATVESSYEQITLAKGAEKTGEPIALAVLPGGDVLHTSRDGRVWYTTADASTSLAGTIPVYSHDEDGLQGVAIDPNFAENRWVYLYYAPRLSTPAGDAPENGTGPESFAAFDGHNQLSRFTLTDQNTIDLASEKKILEVEASRGTCCHAGGEIDFDAEGNLYLSTGDDTNPFASDGYTPIDERATRNPAYDAQRSSGNTNDLRGKLLRITLKDDGTYTVPDGNLFAPGTDKTRPEIYAMGFRNPFRFSVDKATGYVHLGDYGPDAGAANPNRGPGGSVEFNVITEPGNYGWPYCVGDNVPYVDHDFATGTSGAAFDCAAPKNTSPNNTGLVDLPPAIAAWQPYDGGNVPAFGSGGESPMGAVVYDYDPELASETKFPEYYDGKPLLYEWERRWIKEAVLDEDGSPAGFAPALTGLDIRRPMNLEFGPDGSLYVLDYGSGYFGGAADSAVYRIDYVKGSRSPVAEIEASVTNGGVPLEVVLDGSGSKHPENLPLTYAWDVDSDGTVDSTEPVVTHTYTAKGQYTARLTVTAPDGKTGVSTTTVTVGNTAPVVTLELPQDGQFFDFGDQVPFKVTVTDAEDGTQVNCDSVVVEYILGHDNHGHPLSSATGCEGVLTTVKDEGHGLDANIFGVVNATYTDGGAEGVPSLTGDDEAVLHTRTKQAEYFTAQQGVQVVDKAAAEGAKQLGYIAPGDWFAFDRMNLKDITGISARYTSGNAGGLIDVRVGASDGPLLGTITMGSTGSWETHASSDVVPITDPGGTSTLFFVARSASGGTGDMFDVDSLHFAGKGAANNVAPRITSVTGTPTTGDAPLDVTFTAAATDADGDALTYAWDFGDGGTGTGAQVAHTYTTGGAFTATVTVTDLAGASASGTVKVTTFGALECTEPDPQRGPEDEFLGASIDACRWDVHSYRPDLAEVRDGKWVVTTTDDDFYGTANSPVPNIVTTDQPGDTWTVETSFTAPLARSAQQGGLIVYLDEKNYVKLDVVGNDDGSVRAELRSEVGDVTQNPQPGIDNLAKPVYGEYQLRLSRAGDTFTGQVSVDNGQTWAALPGGVTNPAAKDAGVGVFALGKLAGAAQIDVAFDYVRLVDGTTPPTCEGTTASDTFEGTELDACRWYVVNPDASRLAVSDGALRLTTTDDDVFGATNSTVPNILRNKIVTGDRWTVETTVTSDLTQNYHQGGLMVFKDQANYVKVGVIHNGAAAGTVGFEARSEKGDVVQDPQPGVSDLPREADKNYHVRLARDGNTFTGSWSLDGVTWTDLAPVTNDTLAGIAPGPFALGKNQTAPTTVAFGDVTFVEDEPEVCEPATPAEGYRMLFDGTAESLAGWKMAGPGGFELQEDCSMRSTGGMGLLWYPEELEAYSLTLDWKMAGDDNSGVFVGFPDPGNDPWVAVNQGYEIQIDATDADDRTTGAIYTFQSADLAARDAVLKAPGEWNAYEIRVEGQRIRVFLNGTLINDFTSTEPSRDLSSGFIGLQNHGNGDDVSFRDVQVKDLTVEPEPEVEVTSTVKSQCVGRTANVSVRVVNDEDVPADIVVTTPFGTKTFLGVLPGKSAHQSFSARAGALEAGVAQVTATAGGRTTTFDVAYGATSCG